MKEEQIKQLQANYYISKYGQLMQYATNAADRAYYQYMLEKELESRKES